MDSEEDGPFVGKNGDSCFCVTFVTIGIMKTIYRKAVRWKDIKIQALFRFFIQRRIENNFALRVFYTLFIASTRLYIERQFKPERQHYIPRYILENFKIPNTGQIYEYSICKAQPARSSITKEAACIPNYYSFMHIQRRGWSNFVEKNLFAEIVERFGKEVVSDLEQNKYNSIISLEQNILATHTAFQYTRTPAFRAQLKIYMLFLLEKEGVSRDVFSNKGKERLDGIFMKNSLHINIYDVQEFAREVALGAQSVDKLLAGHLDNISHTCSHLATLIGSALIRDLFYKKITVLHAEDPYYFLLPDSGVMVCDTKDPDGRWPFGWDFSKKSVIVLLPISPTKCVVFASRPVNDEMRETFTQLGLGCAYYQSLKHVYADRDLALIQENINGLHHCS